MRNKFLLVKKLMSIKSDSHKKVFKNSKKKLKYEIIHQFSSLRKRRRKKTYAKKTHLYGKWLDKKIVI